VGQDWLRFEKWLQQVLYLKSAAKAVDWHTNVNTASLHVPAASAADLKLTT
jgi:hypothetical protein